MLTYCTRLNLNHGHLIYPHTTNTTSHHHITGTNITIHRHGLDLTAEPTMLLHHINDLAHALTAPHQP
ncbi:hypothetical protein GZ206_10975 [Dermatophilus congolensis]|nr:hypothetical protein [Dermatophilus congolensis]